MSQDLRNLLKIPYERIDDINAVLLNPDERVVNDFLAVVEKYGTPEEINAQAAEARKLENLLAKVKPEYLEDLKWLEEQRDAGAFITVDAYKEKVLGEKAATTEFLDDFAVVIDGELLCYSQRTEL